MLCMKIHNILSLDIKCNNRVIHNVQKADPPTPPTVTPPPHPIFGNPYIFSQPYLLMAFFSIFDFSP